MKKQTILFLRNGQLFTSKADALAGIKAVAHVAGQPVVALYREEEEGSSVKLIFAIGTEEGKCEIMATDADLAALAELVTANAEAIKLLNGDAETEGSVAKAIADAIAASKEAYEAADAQLKSDLEAYADQAEADAKDYADEKIAESAATTKEAYEAYADQAEADAIAAAKTETENQVKAAKDEIDAYTVNGYAISENPVLAASDIAIADENEHFAAATVEAALEELYSQAGAGSKVTMKSEAGEGDVATIYKFYQGGEDADHLVGEINIGKEMFIESGEVIEKEGVPYLKLTLNNTNKTVLEIDLTQVMGVYTNGNGINVDANVISVKKATDSEEFLVVDENGVAIKGVQTAIDNAKDAAIAAAKTETENQVKAAKDEIDAYTVNGYAISENPVLVASDIEYSEGVTVDAKIDAVAEAAAQAVADEKARAEEAEGNLQESIEAAQAAATTVIEEKSEGHVTVSVEEAEDGHKVYTIEENDIASAQDLADEITRAKEAEAALAEIADDINAELYKVKLNADDENADYLANKVVSGVADVDNNVYAATVAANEAGALAISVKIDTIDGGTY